MDKIYIELNEGYEFEPGASYSLDIILDDIKIGHISGSHCGDGLILELIAIEPQYRNLGYGTKAMEILIDIASNMPNIEFIRGECPNSRIDFYTRLGAIFECRDEYDEDFINNVFYIDLPI